MRSLTIGIAALAAVLCASLPSAHGQERIIGGLPITGGMMRAQMVQLMANDRPLCSGVFLNSQWVMTAAHCFDQSGSDVTAVHLSGSARVLRVHRHPGYNSATGAADIALLQLIEAAPGAVGTTPAGANPAAGDQILVAGFGITDGGTAGNANIGFQIVRDCPAGTAGAAVGLRWCAGQGDDSATCYGDSGGPVFDGGGTVAGITSMTATGCPRGGITIYTAVAPYLDWINGIAMDGAARSGWYRQAGVDAEGWSVQFSGAKAFLGWFGYDLAGNATWTVASLTRSESGLYEGSPIACRDNRSVRTCDAAAGRVSLAVTATGLTLRSTAEATARQLVPHRP